MEKNNLKNSDCENVKKELIEIINKIDCDNFSNLPQPFLFESSNLLALVSNPPYDDIPLPVFEKEKDLFNSLFSNIFGKTSFEINYQSIQKVLSQNKKKYGYTFFGANEKRELTLIDTYSNKTITSDLSLLKNENIYQLDNSGNLNLITYDKFIESVIRFINTYSSEIINKSNNPFFTIHIRYELQKSKDLMQTFNHNLKLEMLCKENNRINIGTKIVDTMTKTEATKNKGFLWP